ncbi:MAG: hypothetical protein AAGF12_26730, partial [Myxococcota bacterium]
MSGVLVTAGTVLGAFLLPALDVQLTTDGTQVFAQGLDGREPTAVVGIHSSTGSHRFEAVDLIDEPDVIPTWEETNRFFDRQTALTRVLEGRDLELETGTGERVEVRRSRRAIEHIHWTFYSQLICALLVWLVGFATYAFSDRKRPAVAYALSAVGMAVVLWPAVVYSTRPVSMDGT